jgi:hypothetical protein
MRPDHGAPIDDSSKKEAKMKTSSRMAIVFLAAASLLPIFSSGALAAGGSWAPSWSDGLGIRPDQEPQMGQIVETVMATVVDSTRLTALKFNKVKNGDRVQMVNLGSTWWSVKVGEKLYFPALWNVKLISTGQTQVLIPEKKKPYEPQLPVIEQKTVSVPGNQAWTSTGLTLRPQDRVSVTATGQVCFSGGLQGSCIGPEGWAVDRFQADWPDDYGWAFDPLPEANHAALIGGVGDDLFFIGSNSQFWNKSGPLYLGINDASLAGDFYNTGQFNATVKVEREIVPKP